MTLAFTALCLVSSASANEGPTLTLEEIKDFEAELSQVRRNGDPRLENPFCVRDFIYEHRTFVLQPGVAFYRVFRPT